MFRRSRQSRQITEDGRAYPRYFDRNKSELDQAINDLKSSLIAFARFAYYQTPSEEDVELFLAEIKTLSDSVLLYGERYRGARNLERMYSGPPPQIPE